MNNWLPVLTFLTSGSSTACSFPTVMLASCSSRQAKSPLLALAAAAAQHGEQHHSKCQLTLLPAGGEHGPRRTLERKQNRYVSTLFWLRAKQHMWHVT
jgi:hypothetical protein